jgi:hypothetical protein
MKERQVVTNSIVMSAGKLEASVSGLFEYENSVVEYAVDKIKTSIMMTKCR